MLPAEIKNKKVFVAMLDWGLGHCTRMIPILKQLKNQGCSITLGLNEQQRAFFEKEALNINIIDLAGYNFSIPRKNWEFHFAKQLPALNRALKNEHQNLKILQSKHQFDIVLSDHRYGLYHPDCYSIFVTHQLHLPASIGAKLINKKHHQLLANFDKIWVLDNANNSFAGSLSKNIDYLPISYIGAQSRFEKTAARKEEIDILCIISGPEPHRTDFSERMQEILAQLTQKSILIDAQPGKTFHKKENNLEIYAHASTNQIETWLNDANWVISRSGYTTVMDVLKLDKRALFIPTPGQGEQEYLAIFHSEKNDKIKSLSQAALSLEALKTILSPK